MGKQIKLGGVVYTILFPDALRPLTADERRELKESIEARGAVVVPILIDASNGVIDGANRLEIAAELGHKDIRRVVSMDDLTIEQKKELCEELNSVRRHLTPAEQEEQRAKRRVQRVARVAEGRKGGKSLRTMAAEEGVSKIQIERDLETTLQLSPPGTTGGQNGDCATSSNEETAFQLSRGGTAERQNEKSAENGASAQPTVNGRVAGQDGKSHPTSKKKPAPMMVEEDGVPADGLGDAAELLDETGRSVPEHMASIFEARKDFDQYLSLHRQATVILNKLADHPAGLLLERSKTHHANARSDVAHGRPYAVCGGCKGTGKIRNKPCDVCGPKMLTQGRGWLNETQWRSHRNAFPEIYA